MSEDKYLRIQQVMSRTGLSRATIYNMIKSGNFPPQTSLGARAIAWLESEIEKWMENRKTIIKTGRELRPGRIAATSKAIKKSSPEDSVPKNTLVNASNISETPSPTDKAMLNAFPPQRKEPGTRELKSSFDLSDLSKVPPRKRKGSSFSIIGENNVTVNKISIGPRTPTTNRKRLPK
jgi:prophage regulatory protein